MSLSKQESAHYQRHLILPGFGIEAQEKLKKATVLVIGAGGLGCPILLYLAAVGIGKIGIIDHDEVSTSNLHRQVLFTAEDIGKSKAQVAATKLKQHNPYIELIAYQEQLTPKNALQILEAYDLVIDGSDNFSTRYLVNDACLMSKKPFVSGAIFTYEGQVSVFNYQNGPTYRCLFPEPPSAEEMPNCSEIGVLGVLPGVIGTIMATEAVKLLAEIGEVLSGKLLVYDALSMNFQTLSFEGKEENKHIAQLQDYNFACEIEPFPPSEISAEDLKKWIEKGEDFELIDVREVHEYEFFNIGGTNFPLSTLDKHITGISRTRKTVIHCQAGGRSQKAIEKLKAQGYSNLLNLKNGLKEW